MATSELNPYVPPAANVEVAPGAVPLRRASRWRRFGTVVVDYIGQSLFGALIGGLSVLLIGESAEQWFQRMPDLALGVMVLSIYYLLFEGIWARTPGKLVWGTRVVDESGGPPRFTQIVGRTLCRLIPFEAFSFFGQWGWHDRIPRTYVVLTRVPDDVGTPAEALPRVNR